MDTPQGLVLLLIVAGYLIGSVPFAYLAARSRGVDIFAVGTGNPGTMNTLRMLGRRLGILVFALDVSKGALAVLAGYIAGVEGHWLPLPGIAAVIGHWYPLYLRFRGGEGLATSFGMGIALAPIPGAAAVATGLLARVLIRDTGRAAGVGYLVFIVSCGFLGLWIPAGSVAAISVAIGTRTYLINAARRRARRSAAANPADR
jgi:acyl phosphate:glycerol-3-phosphate acyltransferase